MFQPELNTVPCNVIVLCSPQFCILVPVCGSALQKQVTSSVQSHNTFERYFAPASYILSMFRHFHSTQPESAPGEWPIFPYSQVEVSLQINYSFSRIVAIDVDQDGSNTNTTRGTNMFIFKNKLSSSKRKRKLLFTCFAHVLLLYFWTAVYLHDCFKDRRQSFTSSKTLKLFLFVWQNRLYV